MNVRVDAVTARWADALFNLALRAGDLDEVQRDVERLGAETRSDAVRDYLTGGRVSQVEKTERLVGLVSHRLTQNFVKLALERRRESVLVHVADAFRAKRLEREGVVEGVLECPRPLDASELESLATSLGARLGKRVSLSARLNPDLVGGVRVFVGARMLDRSVQGRLEGLRRKMLAARLPVGAR